MEKFGFGPQGIPLENTLEFATRNLDHSSNEVRQAASDLVLEALKLEGEQRIEPLLESRFRSQRYQTEHQGRHHESLSRLP